MIGTTKSLLKMAASIFGYEIRRPPPDPLILILKKHSIQTVVDVGANQGQFAKRLMKGGFKGRIISIEPLNSAFSILKKNAESSENWEVLQAAAGKANATAEINISGNSVSSSLLPMNSRHETALPESKYIGRETVRIYSLDSLFYDRLETFGHIFLKIDVQGFEKQTLEGATSLVRRSKCILIETSLVPLYNNAMTLGETLDYMSARYFSLQSMAEAFRDYKQDELLQVDCIFTRRSEPTHTASNPQTLPPQSESSVL